MEWEWPEEDKQLLQELQKKQSPDLGGRHARQNDSGVDLDFISPEEVRASVEFPKSRSHTSH